MVLDIMEIEYFLRYSSFLTSSTFFFNYLWFVSTKRNLVVHEHIDSFSFLTITKSSTFDFQQPLSRRSTSIKISWLAPKNSVMRSMLYQPIRKLQSATSTTSAMPAQMCGMDYENPPKIADLSLKHVFMTTLSILSSPIRL